MKEDFSKLSSAQGNVLGAVRSGYTDVRVYTQNTVVSLCVRGLASLDSNGQVHLTERGMAAAYALESRDPWS